MIFKNILLYFKKGKVKQSSKGKAKRNKKLPSFKLLIFLGVVLLLLVVVLFSMYANRGFLSLLSIQATPQKFNAYQDKNILFYDINCSHCVKVDNFIRANNIEDKIDFIRLEILDNDLNKNILADKAQICGLPSKYIGVPFLWVVESKKCIVGYVDIIDFFKTLPKI